MDRNIDVQEKHQSVASHMPPTRDLHPNPGMCPDRESNQWPFSLQAGSQSTEPHQPVLYSILKMFKIFSHLEYEHFYYLESK